MAAFEIRDLSFTYPDETAPALRHIRMDIPEGKITLICGASGSGKSTLLRRLKTCLADHGEAEGEVLFFGKPLGEVAQAEQARRIGFVFQHPDDQIVTDKVFHELAFGPESLGWDQRKMRLAVAEMASYFGLSELFMKNVSELSGGQKQLVNLASVAVMRPDVLILDEPTSRLDPVAASDFLAALRKLNEDLGLTIVLTEHRLDEALPMADMLAVLDNGRLIAYDEPRKAAMQIKDSAAFESMPSAVRIFAALGGEGDTPLTVSEGRAFIASRARKSVDIMRSSDHKPGDLAVEIKNCWFRYEKNAPDVLCGLELKLYRGELCALLGGNGSGKSTLVHLLEHGAAEAVALVLGEHADGLNVSGVGYDHGSAVTDGAPVALAAFRVLPRQLEHVVGAGRVGQFLKEHVDVPGVGGEQGGFHAVHGLHVREFGNAQAGAQS